MLKKSLIYLILSVFVVLFTHYIHLLVVYIDIFYAHANLRVAPLFSTSKAGIISCGVVLLTGIPLCITLVPALVYRAIKGNMIPYFYEATWAIWLILVVSKIVI
jgi:hypothetical protein